jgi:hypothetical protein
MTFITHLFPASTLSHDHTAIAAAFIHPLIAATGLGLATIPIIIHLLNRRRFREMPWAAMTFLLAANQRTARRVRFEQWLLLALRVLIIAVIGMAVARPFVQASPLGAVGLTRTHRILMIDDSGSMAALDSTGAAVFDRAKAAAISLIDRFPTGDGISIIRLSGPARSVLNRPAYEHAVVTRTLQNLSSTARRTDLTGAFELAEEILADSDATPGNRAVYLITDNAASAWAAGGPDANTLDNLIERVAEDARLFIIHCHGDRTDNLAVTELAPQQSLMGTAMPTGWLAEVGNFGQRQSAPLEVDLIHTGRLVRTETLPALQPGQAQQLRFQLHADQPGQQTVQVKLRAAPGDALDLDNARAAVAHAADRVPVLLVDGKPGVDPFNGQAGYLAAAFSPKLSANEKTWIAPKIVTDLELPGEVLADYRLIVLCNVRRLPPELWPRLAEYVAAGNAAWIFLGDQVDADHYNQHAYAQGAGILPAQLAAPVGDVDDRENYAILQLTAPPHPATADFAGQTTSGLFLARVDRHFAVNLSDADPVTTVLNYNTGAPAILEKPLGKGNVALCTTTANMDWNNLPAKGDFVSLLLNMLADLLPSAADDYNVAVGNPLNLPITARQAALPIQWILPDGRKRDVSLTQNQDNVLTDIEAVDQIGIHLFKIGQETINVAVNMDRDESDLRSLTQKELTERLDCEFEYVEVEGEMAARSFDAPNRELATILLATLLGLLMVETFIAMRFGHHH